METVEQVAETHKALSAIHPVLGKLFALTTVLCMVGYSILKTEMMYWMGFYASLVTSGYYTWRWIHNYRVTKKYPNRILK